MSGISNVQNVVTPKVKMEETGKSSYDKVKKVGSFISFGTGMIISCCASCGDVHSLRIENPDKL